jgi:hypothetical protein
MMSLRDGKAVFDKMFEKGSIYERTVGQNLREKLKATADPKENIRLMERIVCMDTPDIQAAVAAMNIDPAEVTRLVEFWRIGMQYYMYFLLELTLEKRKPNHVRVCGYCLNPSDKLQFCAKCKQMQYCSKECQKEVPSRTFTFLCPPPVLTRVTRC